MLNLTGSICIYATVRGDLGQGNGLAMLGKGRSLHHGDGANQARFGA